MKILVTGAAGFIGNAVAIALLKKSYCVVGVDNINSYYSKKLKNARLERIGDTKRFEFHQMDVSDYNALSDIFAKHDFDSVIHLAAQAGVRYSIENPFAYAQSNILGHLSILESVRRTKSEPFLIYVSSSSVYGNDTQAPFLEAARADKPVSLYAATKRSDELMSESYTSLYGINQVGLRFFTVYGPWGRPDMAYWLFSERIMAGQNINVFNEGNLRRDFTWIDDIVDGIVRVLEGGKRADLPQHRVYNIGNNRSEKLLDFIDTLERALGLSSRKTFLPMQAGDVYETSADISAIQSHYGFSPATPISEGLPIFAEWFKNYYGKFK